MSMAGLRTYRRLVMGAALLLGAALAATSCGESASLGVAGPDLRPVVTIVASSLDTSLVHPATWSATVSWSVTDADGLVLRSEYALDPTPSETSWVQVRESRATVDFKLRQRQANGNLPPEYHIFVLRALDNHELASPVVSRAFYAGTVAPSLQIAQPAPGLQRVASVPQSFTVAWTGDDPDGYPTHRPSQYRVRTILAGDPLYQLALAAPDTLVRLAERDDWQGWTCLGGDTTSITLTGLPLDADGLFAAVAFDAQGAHTPQLRLEQNLLQFHVSDAAPRIHFLGGFLDWTSTGGIQTDPADLFPVQVPAGSILNISWEAISAPGSRIQYTSWVLDPVDVADTTRRAEPADLHHWSERSPTIPTAVLLPAFLDRVEHVFYVEAVDNLGRRSVAGLRLIPVQPDFHRELLIVDDTRLEPDKFNRQTGCPFLYTRRWPSAAELDTFLYARGNVPWRCAQADPTASSVRGLFAGYAFDTLGTRLGLEDPSQAVTLARLAQYQHVLWLVDQQSALIDNSTPAPPTALRVMSSPGHADALYAYGRIGGQIWLAGGGTALASLVSFNVPANDGPQGVVFDHQRDELHIGQLLYDQGHLRSAIAVSRAGGLRYTRSDAARGGWSGQGEQGNLSAPDYALMPAELRVRTPDSDALPPTRIASQAGLYYPGATDAEYVSAPNTIVEDVDPDPQVVHLASTLDTLYDVSGSALVISPAPAMTYYHGRENPQFLFTGFDLWSWKRSDAQGLVDFVLRDVWGMSQATPRAAAARATSGSGGGRRAAFRGAPWHRLDPSSAHP
jgi:hypothetical protein